MEKITTYSVGLIAGVVFITSVLGPVLGPVVGPVLGEDIKVVSLDYCADQYVLALADKDQILAVTKGAKLADSFYKTRAANLTTFSATAAEVIGLRPTLAVETWTANPNLKDLGSRVGINIITTKFVPANETGFETLFYNLNFVGKALGQQKRATIFVEKAKDNLAWLRAQGPSPLTVAYLTPSGYTAGTGTVVDDIIKLAGFKTYAEGQGLVGWQPLPLEDLVMSPPDVILTSFFDTNLETRSKWSLSRHAQISDMLETLPRVDLPGKYLACSGLFAIEAAVKIRQLADEQGLIKAVVKSHE